MDDIAWYSAKLLKEIRDSLREIVRMLKVKPESMPGVSTDQEIGQLIKKIEVDDSINAEDMEKNLMDLIQEE